MIYESINMYKIIIKIIVHITLSKLTISIDWLSIKKFYSGSVNNTPTIIKFVLYITLNFNVLYILYIKIQYNFSHEQSFNSWNSQ